MSKEEILEELTSILDTMEEIKKKVAYLDLETESYYKTNNERLDIDVPFKFEFSSEEEKEFLKQYNISQIDWDIHNAFIELYSKSNDLESLSKDSGTALHQFMKVKMSGNDCI